MFQLNFKKDWHMHKSLLISFFVTCFTIMLFIVGFYLIIKYVDLNEGTFDIVNGIWMFFSTLATMLATVLPIALMVMVLKSDLGKNNIHYTIFTPQSIFSWYFPKVLFVFIIQALFASIQVIYANLVLDVFPNGTSMGLLENIVVFITESFSVGLFGLITLSMAIYYSFRNKKKAWLLIVLSIWAYGIFNAAYLVIKSLQGDDIMNIDTQTLLIQYGFDTVIGLILIFIAMRLFDKKVEY